jgi:hypothetical protein
MLPKKGEKLGEQHVSSRPMLYCSVSVTVSYFAWDLGLTQRGLKGCSDYFPLSKSKNLQKSRQKKIVTSTIFAHLL